VVISDTDAVYLYGLDIIAEQLAGADRYYYVHDGLGSVRQLLDSAGQIETAYAYDPFGVPLAGDGVPNPWQFTGEAWDAEVELLYLRARYYQPETGRSVTKDPSAGDRQSPGTLNRYLYVNDNPVNDADPTGLNGGGPEGYCPEAKEYFHPLEITWPSGSRETECPEKFHEWVEHWEWPDPWGDEPLGSPDEEYIPPLREVLIAQAEEMYEKYVGLKNLEAMAQSRQNNPLTGKALEPGCLGGITNRMIGNWLQPPFHILLATLGMNPLHQTNYEAYYLTVLMEKNENDLRYAKESVYDWWCQWIIQFGSEPEEFFHPVIAE
jgi:RHS repeat-associated protein